MRSFEIQVEQDKRWKCSCSYLYLPVCGTFSAQYAWQYATIHRYILSTHNKETTRHVGTKAKKIESGCNHAIYPHPKQVLVEE